MAIRKNIFRNTKDSDSQSDNKLKIIAMSGTIGVTKNMTVYEYGDDIIILDCGVGFPDSEMYGVDVVIPDFTYLLENRHKVRGLFVTHGHEDHLGAVPYFLRELEVPIYSNKLVLEFIKQRISDRATKELADATSYNLIAPDSGEVVLGNFKVSTFRVNHSVPSSMGFKIETPEGVVVHMADYRVDWTPVLDKPIDIATISDLGRKGVLCLLSDCLGSTTEGYSKSESTLNDTFSELFEKADDRQIMVTTISSNISRMYQIITAAQKFGRKVVLVGRSIEQSVRVARNLGYLPFDDAVFVSDRDSAKFLQKDLVYIVAGCYGQQGSALDRIAREEHRNVVMEEEAVVIFSADPSPPGVEEAVEKLMDVLTLNGGEVIYSQIQDNLHVSGHGTKGDLMMIAALVRPKYFIPIGGTVTKMRAYKRMVGELGMDSSTVFEQPEGGTIIFSNGNATVGDTLPVKQVYVDGSSIGEIGPTVIRDREKLSDDGVFMVVVPISKETNELTGKVEIITRGFVYVKESKALIGRARDVIYKVLDKQESLKDWNSVRNTVEKDLSKFLYKETKRRPLLMVTSINV